MQPRAIRTVGAQSHLHICINACIISNSRDKALLRSLLHTASAGCGCTLGCNARLSGFNSGEKAEVDRQ